MNLVIDQGNTRTKFALLQDKEIAFFDIAENDEAVGFLESLLREYSPAKCMLVSVTDADALQSTLQKSETPTYTLDEETILPFSNLYGSPKTLGKDRLAAIAGAFSLRPYENCLVIDAGTALTFDFINERGEYLGGSISPGLAMRSKALHQFTSKLPQTIINPKVSMIGNDTISCIQSGVFWGMTHEIDGFIDHYKENTSDLFVFLTGGDALLFDKSIKNSIFVAQNLVLSGLNSLLEQNAL